MRPLSQMEPPGYPQKSGVPDGQDDPDLVVYDEDVVGVLGRPAVEDGRLALSPRYARSVPMNRSGVDTLPLAMFGLWST